MKIVVAAASTPALRSHPHVRNQGMHGTYHDMACAFVLDPLRAKEDPVDAGKSCSERICVIVVLACKPIL